MLKQFSFLTCLLIPALAGAQCMKAGAGSLRGGIADAGAVAKMNRYDVKYYHLDLALNDSTTNVAGQVTMYAEATEDLDEIVLELHDTFMIDQVLLNGAQVSHTLSGGLLTLIPGAILQPGLFTTRIQYHGTAPQLNAAAIGNGLSTSTGRRVTWSLSQPFAAYEWWPCKQVLTDKADSSDVWITVDTSNKAGSNGLLEHITALGGGKVRYEWKSRYPIAYYLISVTAGRYQERNAYAHPEGSDSILVQNYLYRTASQATMEAAIAGVDAAPALIELFSDKLGLYPFAREKYGHCQAPVSGGMEHQTMTTLGAFGFEIIAHELGHQWFGDEVTCGSWGDIWLNEGFASYLEYVALENLKPADKANWVNTAMAYALDSWNTVHSPDTETVNRIFDYRSTYKKGGVALHMLRHEINNDSVFFAGLRAYLAAHRYGNAFTSDFQVAMEQATGQSLQQFFSQWIYGYGYPVYSASWRQQNGKLIVKLTQRSTNTATPLFATALDLAIGYAGGFSMNRRVITNSAVNVFVFDDTLQVTGIAIDRDNWVLNGVDTIYKDETLAGMNEPQHAVSFSLYPNPGSRYVHIICEDLLSVCVTDLAGRVMMEHSNTSSIDMGGLVRGMYVVTVTTERGRGARMFVKE
jgi:aminopeptidase N